MASNDSNVPARRPQYEDPDYFHFYKGNYLPFPWHKSLAEVETLEARDGDVCVVSFPKSGTGWMSAVVLMIMNNGDPACLHSGKPVNFSVPMLEQVFPQEIDNPDVRNIRRIKGSEGPRIYATHLCAEAIPQSVSHKAKIIYIYRNPKDVLVSLFHWLRGLRQVGFNRDVDWLADEFMDKDGKIFFGPYFNNIAGYWRLREQKNVFICSYEDVLRDFNGYVDKMARFLGKTFSEAQIDTICRECSFEHMKANPVANRQERDTMNIYDSKVSPYLRKGAAGKWHDTLSEQTSAKLDQWITDNLAQLKLRDFEFRFE